MQITLNQDEMETAIKAFVLSQITIASNQNVSISLHAGRGTNGFSAEITLNSNTENDGHIPQPRQAVTDTVEESTTFKKPTTSKKSATKETEDVKEEEVKEVEDDPQDESQDDSQESMEPEQPIEQESEDDNEKDSDDTQKKGKSLKFGKKANTDSDSKEPKTKAGAIFNFKA